VAGRGGHRGIARAGFMAALFAIGCGDEVVGYFGGGSGEGSDDGTTTTTTGASDGGTTVELPDPFVGPGCFSDQFENGIIDEALWYPWAEPGSNVEEVAGMLKFTPPPMGLLDTGVVGSITAHFRFVDGRVRLRVATPPATTRPVVLFLQILREDPRNDLVSINLAESNLHVSARSGEIDVFGQDFPAAPYPAWIAIRAEGTLVHYEVSDDGVAFTTLATWEQTEPYEVATALIMAQTYGDDLEGGIVAVDDFEVCLD
jgi:hypothetical protein